MGVILVALFLAGCSATIPREEVPPDWSLNVHQPGEWWTQPLIPRSVVVQRCPPPRFWSSDPDLTRVTAMVPGTDVNYSHWVDDYHCLIGWSEQQRTLETALDADELTTEAGLRKVCSTSGLPMDASWRYLGFQTHELLGDLSGYDDQGEPQPTVAAFIDDHETVVACYARDDSAWVDLSAGADLSAASTPICPVTVQPIAAAEDRIEEYDLTGAGAVRGSDGRVLAAAKTLRVGAVGDSVRVTAPVVDGVAIVNATVRPKVPLAGDWDTPPPVQGEVLDANGKVLATCRA